MHIDTQSLVALGVALHLLGALAKMIWRSPRQQVQINLIEAKIDLLLGQNGVHK